jgi:hypothetical protein
MALTPEDLEQLGAFIDQKVTAAVAGAQPQAPPDPPDLAARKEAEPWYYVHLADGRVLETQDSQSTVMEGLAVVGRFPKLPEATA